MTDAAETSTPFLRTCIITCPARKESLEETFRSYAAADFAHPAVVFLDSGHSADPRLSQMGNSLFAITSMLDLEWEWLLFAEDDVEFNRHIEYNLRTWPLLNSGDVICGKLYNAEPYPDGLILDPFKVAGSQGILLSRDAVKIAIAQWHGFESTVMQDLRIYRILRRVHAHDPSLVQHRSVPSTWGGLAHTSPTFDINWRRAI
jgi:hypothetical protein